MKPKLPDDIDVEPRPIAPDNIKLRDPCQLLMNVDPMRGINEPDFPPITIVDEIPLEPADINWHDPPPAFIISEEDF